MKIKSRSLWVGSFCLALLSPVFAADYPVQKDARYRDTKELLSSLASQFPDRAKTLSIGLSDSGEPIMALQVGDGPVRNLVVATHHGNEYGSTEVAKAFAWSLAEAPIKGQTVYIVPVLNIGGYDSRNRYEINAKGEHYDPNRNYPSPCGSEGPFTLKSTRALADFVEREQIVTSATLHTYFPAVVWPWGISTRDVETPYTDLFRMLATAATVESRYDIGNSTELIYPADGTFEDYAYWKHGIWSMLFELGESHWPSLDDLQKMVTENVPGLRRMLEQAPTTRAENHSFTGQCDYRLKALDRHDE